MCRTERTSYGFKIRFEGYIEKDELKSWAKEAATILKEQKPGFGVLHDMRGMAPLPVDAGEFMKRNQALAKDAGLSRSAQILDDPITKMQFKRLARDIELFHDMRQIDASRTPNWEQVAINWIVDGVEPEET